MGKLKLLPQINVINGLTTRLNLELGGFSNFPGLALAVLQCHPEISLNITPSSSNGYFFGEIVRKL